MSDRANEVADRLRSALVPAAAARSAGRSRGASYDPAEVARRLRRVAALRRACLRLRGAARTPRTGGGLSERAFV